MRNKSFSIAHPVAYGFINRLWCITLLFSLLTWSVISQSAFSSSTHAGELSLNLFRESVDKVKDCNSVGNVPKAKVQESYGKLPLYFIQNTGQMDEKIQFYEKNCGCSMFFTKRGIYLSLASGRQSEVSSQGSGISRPWWHGQTCLSVPNMSKFKTDTVRGKAENKLSGSRNPHSVIENSAIQNPQSENLQSNI